MAGRARIEAGEESESSRCGCGRVSICLGRSRIRVCGPEEEEAGAAEDSSQARTLALGFHDRVHEMLLVDQAFAWARVRQESRIPCNDRAGGDIRHCGGHEAVRPSAGIWIWIHSIGV